MKDFCLFGIINFCEGFFFSQIWPLCEICNILNTGRNTVPLQYIRDQLEIVNQKLCIVQYNEMHEQARNYQG